MPKHQGESPVGIVFGLIGAAALPFAISGAVEGGKWLWKNRGDLANQLKKEATPENDEGDHERD